MLLIGLATFASLLYNRRSPSMPSRQQVSITTLPNALWPAYTLGARYECARMRCEFAVNQGEITELTDAVISIGGDPFPTGMKDPNSLI
jgi:hypothetical protein